MKMYYQLKCHATKTIEKPYMLSIVLAQNMTRAARAPAPTSGATVAMAPMALEFELDAVPPEAAEEAPLACDEVEDETKLFKEEVTEDVLFSVEELELDVTEEPDAEEVKIVVIPTVEVYVVLLSVTVVRIGEVVMATAPVPLPLLVAPADPEVAPVLAGTPAPGFMSVELDG